MKKISIYGLAALAIGAMMTQSCSDNWEEPAMAVPTFPEGTEANITIAELKAKYWQDQDAYGTTIGTAEDGTHYTIIGTVTSSCAAGNIYKSLYLQDATGAICIGIDTAAVSSAYPQGPALAIDVTGLCIGRFNGAMQMGTLVGNGVNRITMPELRPHVKIDFFKGKADTLTVDIPTINEAINSTEGLIQYGGRLIRIDGVHFKDAGQPFAANGNSTSRTLVDEQGNRIIIYNRSYADFANKLLPTGTGSVVGILSNYRTSWQILLNDVNGLIGFDPIQDGGSDEPGVTVEPKGDGTAANPYNVAKAMEIVNTGAVTDKEVYVTGIIDQITEVDTGSYGNATYSINDGTGTASMLVYRGKWLNNAKFTSADQIQEGKEVVVLGKLMAYNGNPQIGQGNYLVKYDGQGGTPDEPSTPGTPEGEGTAASPYNVTAALDVAKALADGDKKAAYAKGKVASITEVDTGDFGNATYAITDGSATLQVYRGYYLNGEKFTSADQLKVGDEVVISGDLVNYKGNTPQFTQGSRIVSINGQGAPETPVDDSVFLSGTSDKGAEGWTLTGTEKWSWQSYSGKYYLNISCQNDPQTEDLYAISPVIDLAAKGYKSMSFMHAAKFQTGGFKEKCQIGIREEGAKDWTVLKFTGYPGTDSWTFVNSGDIDISAYAGKKVQVAFIYGAGCTDKWEINDLTFAE